MESLTDSQPSLSYADLPARWGVSLIRNETGLRIIIPPVPSWRQLHKGFFIAGAILAAFDSLISFIAIRERQPDAIPSLLIYGGVLFTVIMVAFFRLHRRLIFDITADEVALWSISPLISPGRRSWPRSDISEIKRNRSSGKLLIRVTGKEMIEIYVSPDAQLTQWLGETLDRELRSPVPLDHVRHVAHAPPAITPQSRRRLLGLSYAIIGICLVLCLFGFPWAVLGFYGLIFAGIPAGIALGTQEKDYYFF